MSRQDLPFNYFFENGNFVTRYSENILNPILVKEKFSDESNLSYSSQSMISRFNDFYDRDYPMLNVWSDETLINVILSDRKYLEREIKNRDIIDFESLSTEDLLYNYFDGQPTREDLVNLIVSIIDTEYELEDNYEFSIGYLMAGIFYFPGWLRNNGSEDWEVNRGNFQYLNEEDVDKIKILYGLSKDSSNINIMMTISNEQHLIISEIVTKDGLSEENVDILSKIIQCVN